MSGQTEACKKPSSAYFLWLNANREKIQKDLGTKDIGPVGKKAGELWKALSAVEKKPFEEQIKKQKEDFEAFKATPEGQQALEAKKEERKDRKGDKLKKEAKKAAKAVEKDDRLKKPSTAYFLWMNGSREAIQKAAGSTDMGAVAKKASEMWKALSAAELKPWEDKAGAAKKAYEDFVQTPEGEEALKSYKEAVSGAKKACKEACKDEVASISPAAERKAAKEAKDLAKELQQADKSAKKEALAAKKAAGKSPKVQAGGKRPAAKAPEPEVGIPQTVADKAQKLGMVDVLKKLVGRPDIQAEKITPSDALAALEKSGGLLHPARHALLERIEGDAAKRVCVAGA